MKRLFSTMIFAVIVLAMLVGTLTSCDSVEGIVNDIMNEDFIQNIINGKDNNANTNNTENTGNNNTNQVDETEAKYNAAIALIEDGKYEEAYEAFKALGDYKDSEQYLAKFTYLPTVVTYVLSGRSGVMNVTFGKFNLPSQIISDGDAGKRDGTYTYDDQGNLMRQEMKYNGDVMMYDYSYDEYNRHIGAVYTHNGVETHSYEYIYNDLGQIVKVIYSEEGGYTEESIYNYSDDSQNYTEYLYIINGVTVCAYTYTHNEDGNVTSEHLEDYTGGYYYTINYIYDIFGKLIQEIYTDAEQQLVANYTYDAAGNCIKAECLYPNGTSHVLTKEYDAHGNVIKEVQISADGEVKSVETQYTLLYIPIDVPESTMLNINSILFVTTDY